MRLPHMRAQRPGELPDAAGHAANARRLDYEAKHERKLLHDALLYLQARKLGCAVLTRNIGDFDPLNQLVPGGHILLYRQACV